MKAIRILNTLFHVYTLSREVIVAINEEKVNDSPNIRAGAAYLSIITPAIRLNKFKCCSLWCFESEIFPPEAYVASKKINEPETQDETETQSEGESVSSENSGAQLER